MSDLRESRLRNLAEQRVLGINPYQDRFDTTHTLQAAYEAADGTPVTLAGRLLTRRSFGKLVFATILDGTGRLQISFEKTSLSAEMFRLGEKLVDLGDYIGFTGEMWTTRRGERTARVLDLTPLSKALRPLPEKWHGLQDPDTRYRQRYLDLIASPATTDRFLLRSRVITFIRRYLDDHRFLEVETPILQTASSGAAARPFVTRHAALGRDLYLRISPETYLKRLIVGGLERVYEIGKNFRNEGIDASHLQEFTMLEWYVAYWNYRDNMRFVKDLIQALLNEFAGGTSITYQGVKLDFGGDWPEVPYYDAIEAESGISLDQLRTREELGRAVKARFPDIKTDACKSYPALVDALYKRVVRPGLVQPTFLFHHPTELVPLARRNDANPRILDMFQVVVNSWEIVKAYSELIDPVEQRSRMLEQQSYRDQGDDETMMMEEDYLVCMEHGMPPNSGLGLGIDRLVAILVDAETLRDVVYFPALREAGSGSGPAVTETDADR